MCSFELMILVSKSGGSWFLFFVLLLQLKCEILLHIIIMFALGNPSFFKLTLHVGAYGLTQIIWQITSPFSIRLERTIAPLFDWSFWLWRRWVLNLDFIPYECDVWSERFWLPNNYRYVIDILIFITLMQKFSRY